MKTEKVCQRLQDVYSLNTSLIPEEVSGDSEAVPVSCIIHGDYLTNYGTLRRSTAGFSPGCEECRRTYMKPGQHFHYLRKAKLKEIERSGDDNFHDPLV